MTAGLAPLVYDPQLNWWEARAPRHPQVRIFVATDEDTEASLAAAESVCRRLKWWQAQARRFARTRLQMGPLDLHLHSISFHAPGRVVFFFEGGPALAECAVEVSGSWRVGLSHVRLAG
jgi:hypothetical protein